MKLRVLCIGDVVGTTGKAVFQKYAARLQEQYNIHLTIVNGENSAGDGRGITPRVADFFKHLKVNVITSGNHIWDKKEIQSYIQLHRDFLLRPANFPSQAPGTGVTIVHHLGTPVAVVNLQGRVFMRELIDDPFTTANSLLTYLKDRAKIIIVDFHAETTAEKAALAFHLDGKVSAVVGTHTHVQTSDNRVLPGGTAFITDLGMVGSLNSSLGMKKEPIIAQFMTQMPTRYQVETAAPFILNGVVIEIDADTGKALSIERIAIVDHDLVIDSKDE